MNENGLSTSQANTLLAQYGKNEIPQDNTSILKKLIFKLVSPINFMLVLAAALSWITQKYFDAYFILVLIFINQTISFWQENKADKSINRLNEKLNTLIKTRRDDKWVEIDSRKLVPGDLIKLNVGDIVPVDGKVISESNLTINSAAVTGESLPVEAHAGDLPYSGSFVTTGEARLLIMATGKNTYFGKTILMMDRSHKRSLLEKDIISISKYLSILSLCAVVILTFISLFYKFELIELLSLDLALIIAGIPISLPTVMTLIIELGVIRLSKKNVIVRRVSALEDLANVSLLLTDKTGTLTANQISTQAIETYNGYSRADVIRLAYIPSIQNEKDAIHKAIINTYSKEDKTSTPYDVLEFLPADSERKRSTTTVKDFDGKIKTISLGAPQIIIGLCNATNDTQQQYAMDVSRFAENGYRSLALAIADGGANEKDMQLVGVISLSDTLRPEATSVLKFLKTNGIESVVLTGDHKKITQQIIKGLNLDKSLVVPKAELEKLKLDSNSFKKIASFAEILPKDKYEIVKAANKFYVTAVTGDGVNDIPPIKEANVGIAVKNAVSALKATADIVLLDEGIEVIKDAIVESRKIFSRVYSYSVYRISESFRLIVTTAVLGIIYRTYPITPLQIIILALLNDIPIISLAYDKVKLLGQPARINTKRRFIFSIFFGLTGTLNSLIFFYITRNLMQMDISVIQTLFFLKLTVSGHLLVFVAHTSERWYKFLPSREVITAVFITQIVASILAYTGFLMPSAVSLIYIAAVWIWAVIWMQFSELIKYFRSGK